MEAEFIKSIIEKAEIISKKSYEVSQKDDKGDLVTNLDIEIEQYLIEQIRQNYPDFDIVSEEFNSNNASSPYLQGSSEADFYSEFVPYLLPSDIIKCSFEEFSGFCRISEISFCGNNYDKMCVTKITIGL